MRAAKRFRYCILALCLCAPLSASTPDSQSANAPTGLAPAGDTPLSAGPLATDLKPGLNRKDIGHALRRVADWQVSRLPQSPQADWTFAALYPGLLAIPNHVAGARYKDEVLKIGRELHFQPGPRVLNADDQAVGQSFLKLYKMRHDPAMLVPIRERMDIQMVDGDDPNKPLWWWCDALFMEPPVLAELTSATRDERYVTWMDKEWTRTLALLFDQSEHLFSRDVTFLDKDEKNGRKIFWSRGNGWVMAGLVRVIDQLPTVSPLRQKYIWQLQQMAAAIAPLQGADGLWRPGLLDAAFYPLPEISGSMFISYALAFGVHKHLLNRAKYEPVIAKSWAGAIAHVYADGRLGCIQPIGSSPETYREASSYTFGVGAFLLAGCEIYEDAPLVNRRKERH